MRFRHEAIRAAALAAVLLPALATRAEEAGRTSWKLANFTWIYRVPAEAGAPGNDHPALVSEAAILKLLGPVQVRVEGADTPLFTASELAPLAKALQEAFAAARPAEDLVLLSTQRRGGHFMDPSQGVTARLFVRGGTLNLIVHDARLDFMDRYSADRTLPTFVYGSRAAAAPVALRAEGATRLRADWLAFPLGSAEAVKAPAAPAAAPAPIAGAGTSGASKPDEGFYELQYQKLKALKRMRDENLISEAEYQQKRDAILKTL